MHKYYTQKDLKIQSIGVTGYSELFSLHRQAATTEWVFSVLSALDGALSQKPHIQYVFRIDKGKPIINWGVVVAFLALMGLNGHRGEVS